MGPNRPLRGSCHCGRNLYIVQFPQNPDPDLNLAARVVFNTHSSQRTILGTPLPAYLRVPLTWHTSQTVPRHADETRAQIRRVYQLHDDMDYSDEDDDDNASPSSGGIHGRGRNKKSNNTYEIRHFCGFCGTPLSYWREQPPGEGDFIQLALGSLLPSDLRDLEEFGVLLPSSPSAPSSVPGSPRPGGEDEKEGGGAASQAGSVGLSTGDDTGDMVGIVGGLPWFDALVEGSRLGRMRWSGGTGTTAMGGEGRGTVRVAWEVMEWTEGEDAAAAPAVVVAGGESPRKRKLEEEVTGGGRAAEMEGVEQ
ncbi:hypothetical protein VTJ49DRAFT_4089 [Mycothermus thermophilus]|uniref:CENP-V/GFA domain-containing protein n=1 Tax=Humicola insolens TaxID=85995 RepID=A0ABR3V656_HUMIN